MESLKSLLERTRDGDAEAFGEVIKRFQDMAFGYAYANVGDFHDAEDAVQEAFLTAYQKLSDLRDPDGFPGWFRRIVLSTCREMTRRRTPPTIPLEETELTSSSLDDPAQHAERNEIQEAIRRAVRSLSAPNRTVTTLFYIDGYSIKEIAESLQTPSGTIKRRLHDSRTQLRGRRDEMWTLVGREVPEMKDEDKTKAELIRERMEMRQRLTDLETSETELKQEQEQTRQKARELLVGLGHLSAGISEMFNNTLTGMIDHTQRLRIREDMPESAEADLRKIEEKGQRGLHLLRQAMQGAHKSVTKKQLFDLKPFLKKLVNSLKRTMPEDIEIYTEWVDQECLVRANRAQMRQMLTNLTQNAREAMPKGGQLTLRLSRFTLDAGDQTPFPDMSSGEWIVLSVTDTGIGIASKYMPNLFKPLFTTKKENAGLGLAYVCGVVALHNGFVDVVSDEGKYTTFNITLPGIGEDQRTRSTEGAPSCA